jgi:peptidoglycan/xylan/chitin deacetylase (PgdA/CDA1 family)
VRVTLTFDNGPAPDVTPRVLDVLRERGVRATFFVVGRQLERPGARATAQRAADEGHWIGNHTLSHSVPLAELADHAAVDREIGDTQALLGALSHPDRLFRPFGRGGIIDAALLGPHALCRLEEGGFTCVLWNSVPRDWEHPDHWVEACLTDVATRAWSVVVLHDLPTGAMDRLPALLDGLDAMGAEVVQEFPDECVPLRRGLRTAAFARLPLAPQVRGRSGGHPVRGSGGSR